MYAIYTIVLTLGFIVLIPRFIFDAIFKGKYAAGFKQRLGFVPQVEARGKKVIWIHCVSVGEVNAARPLAGLLREEFPSSKIVISTTTLTGQKTAQTAFTDIADLIFYFPFDWRSTVRRTLRRIKPSVVLLMETEIWFNFIRETNKSRARIAIVNGRMSEKSLTRYTKIKRFMKRVLGYLDLAAMQENADATRIMSLGLRASKVKVTGNMKFDHDLDEQETVLTGEIRDRFGITPETPLIIAASTHGAEEKWLLDAFKEVWKSSSGSLPRLLIAPRHPERFNEVGEMIKKTGFTWVRRSASPSADDESAEIILLDSIGELRAAYPLAEMVFVGGSLVQHGGQSILEPAAAGKAIITGPHTANFEAAIAEFTEKDAIRQLPAMKQNEIVPSLVRSFKELLADREYRNQLGSNALAAMNNNRGAVHRTLEHILPLLRRRENS